MKYLVTLEIGYREAQYLFNTVQDAGAFMSKLTCNLHKTDDEGNKYKVYMEVVKEEEEDF